MTGGTIVFLKADDLRPRKITFELQDVAHLGAAPAIDRLVIIADTAQITIRAGQQPQPQILRDIGVLILIHHDVRDAAVIFAQHIGMRLEDCQHVQKQIAEIHRVQSQKAGLIGGVKLSKTAVCKITGLGRPHLVGHQSAILPALDHPAEKPHRPPFGVDVIGLHQLFEDTVLIVDIENGEVAAKADKISMAAQHPRGQGMEGAKPDLFRHRADHAGDTHFHLARRLVGEGHSQDVPGFRGAGGDKLGKPRGQDPGLAGAGTR